MLRKLLQAFLPRPGSCHYCRMPLPRDQADFCSNPCRDEWDYYVHY